MHAHVFCVFNVKKVGSLEVYLCHWFTNFW